CLRKYWERTRRASRSFLARLAHRKPAAEGAGEHAGEKEGADLRPRQESIEEKAPDERIRRGDETLRGEEAAEQHQHGEESAERALQKSFDEEGTAHDPLGRADEAHDVDFLTV